MPARAAAPRGRFDLVLCIEVVEHSFAPREIFGALSDYAADDGLILFSTLMQPGEMERIGVNWWYVAPRNGHVSLFTQQAVRAVVQPLGLNSGSINADLHILFRATPPPFARHLFARAART